VFLAFAGFGVFAAHFGTFLGAVDTVWQLAAILPAAVTFMLILSWIRLHRYLILSIEKVARIDSGELRWGEGG
jgi:hypothetical protein